MVAKADDPPDGPERLGRRGPWALVGVLAVLIAAASLIPIPDGSTSELPGGDLPGLDKLGHLVAHGLLALFVWHALAPGRRGALALPAFLGLVAYGLLLELLQILVPTRAFQPLDVVANVLGASLLLVLVWHRGRHRPRG